MVSPTPNKGYTYPVHGGSVNAWDTPLNTNFDYIDLNVGGNYDVTLSSTTAATTYNSSFVTAPSTVSTLTPASSIAQNLVWNVSGTLGSNLQLRFPSAGGIYVVRNNTSGSFTLQARTAAGGSSGPFIEQGSVATVVTDGTNGVLTGTNSQAKLYTYTGDPNGNVAGRAGGTDGSLTDVIWDPDDKQLYPCTVTGTSSSAVWAAVLSRPTSQGILTLKNNTVFPVQTTNTAGASTVYYTPYLGNWTLLSNGSIVYPYQFERFILTLNNPNHVANTLYDIFLCENATGGVASPIIGTGPSWAVGGGSIAAGSGARGTGAGSTELTKMITSGGWVLVNANNINIRNGATVTFCLAQTCIYLGSIWIDGSAGQVTNNYAVGQSRKWGLWNYYNRLPIALAARDNTGSWNYAVNTYRASNNDSTNNASAFQGVAEEQIVGTFTQSCRSGGTGAGTIAIGENSTTTASGQQANNYFDTVNTGGTITATVVLPPQLGIWTLNCLEKASINTTFDGNNSMQLSVQYRG